jgi:predicted signal transduction protein with EAL and GGDEF domain
LMRGRFASRPAEAGALLCVGLTRQQEIIGAVGHELGDRLLHHTGQRLKQFTAADWIARVSDASFAIWLPGADAGLARASAAGIVKLGQEPFQDGDLAIDAMVAVGIALYPSQGTSPGELTQHADIAFRAALKSDDGIAIYDPAVDPHRPERLSLMSDLREALTRDDLFLAYQPKMDVGAGRTSGAEALVRWNHVKRGFLPPDSFITLAEETGNIRSLTRWVMNKGIAQAANWAKRGLALDLSINLSVRDLGDDDLPRRLRELLVDHKLQPDWITLEITESAIMSDPDAAIAMLRRIADLGIDLAVDDFGVGQSSFAYLRRLPVRELKIDKAFVTNLSESEEDRTIVRAIVELGHRLNCRITAEGVENEATLAFLAEVGCDHGQGYFFAKPLATAAFDDFLDNTRWPAKESRA